MGYTSALSLFATALVCFAALAVAETADQPTSTNPPSALPTGSNSTLCAFNDRKSLINSVGTDWQSDNISLLVKTCDNACALVYGSGNPDISGVGAMISYTIQGVVVIIFGPVFAVFVLSFDPNRAESSHFTNPTYHWLYQIGTEIAWCAFQTNLLLAASIAIATIVRVLEVVPVAEVVFLSSLAQYELYVSVAAFCSSALLFERFRGNLPIYILIYFGMAACALQMMKLPSDTSPILAEIIRYCAAVRGYPSPQPLLSDIDLLTTYLTFVLGVSPALLLVLSESKVKVLRAACSSSRFCSTAAFICVQIGSKIKALRDACSLLRACYSRFCSAAAFISVQIGSKVKALRDACSLLRACYSRFCSAIRACSRWSFALFISLCTLAWTTITVWHFIDLQSRRRNLQDLSNGAYQEEQWGFGQVMAILAWAPFFQDFFVKVIFEVAKHIRRRRQEQQQAQNQDATPLQDLATATQCQTISSQAALTADSPDHRLTSISEEALADSPGDTEPINSPTTPVFPHPSPLPRSSSLEQSLPQTLRSRSTWPRNQDGAYLPIRK